MSKSSISAVAPCARNLRRIGWFKVINLSHFCEGDALRRLGRGSSITDRLGLGRCDWDDNPLGLKLRARIPDTLHVYRAVIPAVSSPDDRRVGAEEQNQNAISATTGGSTHPWQKHTVAISDEDMVKGIDMWEFG